MKRSKKLQPAGLVWDRTFEYLFLPVLFLLVIIHLLATYWGTPFLWGVHHLHFFPRWVGWILTIVTLTLFVPSVNNLTLKASESILGVLQRALAGINKYLLFTGAGIVALQLFWSLRTKLFLLGDGCFKLEALASGMITSTEPLDGVIHLQLYRLLATLSPSADPSLAYTVPSVVCGGAFVFMILLLADLLGKTSFQKILIFFMLVTLGSIQLFFGYVESYTTLLVGVTLFLLLSVRFLHGKTNIIFSFLALALSISLHVSAIALIPAFLYLIFWKRQTQGNRFLDVPTVLCMVACSGIVFLAVWKASLVVGEGNMLRQFLPLTATAKSDFTMFCGAHLSEFANELLLISPAGMLLFVFFLLRTLKLKSIGHPTLNFLLISGISGLLLVFAYNCHWGSVDWDLMSFPGISITLFGILSFLKWRGQRTKVKNYGLILIAVSLFHTLPWILVNADRVRSVDRYLMIATHDQHLLGARGGGMWRVGRVLNSVGLVREAEEILKEGIKRNPTEMGCYTYLSNMLHDQGRDDEAIPYLESALQLRPQSTEVRFILGRMYLNTDLQKAIFHLEKVKAQYEHESAFVTGLAKAYMKAERPEDAKNMVQGFLARGQETATMRGLLGASLFLLRDFPNARVEWERALKLNPTEPLAQTGLEKLKELTEE
jgi:hypothetical protein